MSYKRVVKFDYYTVCIVDEKNRENSPVRFDFESWILKVVNNEMGKKTFRLMV